MVLFIIARPARASLVWPYLSLRAPQGRGNLLNKVQSVPHEKRLLLYDRNVRFIQESFIMQILSVKQKNNTLTDDLSHISN